MPFIRLLKKMFLHVLVIIGSVIVIGYCTGMLFAYLMADRMIFPYNGSSYEEGAEIIYLDSKDGERIAAYHLSERSSPLLMLYSHGNGEDIGLIRPTMETFLESGVSVLAYDYPGYGLSSGNASESGVYAAADAAYKYATETLGYKPENITLYGRSLGSGPSCWLAERYPVKGIILDGAFSSTFRVMTKVRVLPWDRFNNLSRLASIQCPVLIVHGKLDQTVPFTHALQNQHALSGQVETLWSPNAGHNDLIEQLGSTYWDTVLHFTGTEH
ncbi:MAG TPA: alpha/beta hydrolase [Opitutae bacterium]|nr:alpha/beta hydrolase [Opitutae bacterium]